MLKNIMKGFGFILGAWLGIGVVGGTTFIVLANNNKFMLKCAKNDPEMFDALKLFRL